MRQLQLVLLFIGIFLSICIPLISILVLYSQERRWMIFPSYKKPDDQSPLEHLVQRLCGKSQAAGVFCGVLIASIHFIHQI
jgi:cytochrome b561